MSLDEFRIPPGTLVTFRDPDQAQLLTAVVLEGEDLTLVRVTLGPNTGIGRWIWRRSIISILESEELDAPTVWERLVYDDGST